MPNINGTVIVTGATGGIGNAIVTRLAAEGWPLHLIDVDQSKLEKLCATLPEGTTFAVSTLVGPNACGDALNTVSGEIAALIHLAGIFVPHNLEASEREIFDDNLQHNAINAYDLSGTVEHRMTNGGRIVFISSLAFNRGAPDYVGYSMAKGALVGLTRALSKRFARHGILVNALAPGIIETPMVDTLIEKRGREKLLSHIPLGRFGRTEEIAGVIRFLLSPDASYITGQLINVDGGTVNS